MMSELKKKIIADLTMSMKNREVLRLSTIRLLKAEIMKFEVSGKQKREVTDEDVCTLVSRLVKQRRDAAEQYRGGGREESAEKEEAEIKILQEYLPEQISVEEVEKIAREVIEEIGAKDRSAFGKVMGLVVSKTKGRTDGKVVKEVVEKLLS